MNNDYKIYTILEILIKSDHAENCEVTLWQRNDNYSRYTDFKSDDNLNTGITRNRIILNLTTRNFFRYAI